MSGDRVGQAAGIVDTRQRGQNLRRHFLVQLDVLVEQVEHRAQQYLRLAIVDRTRLLDHLDRSGIVFVGLQQTVDHDTLAAFHEYLDGTVGQLEHLQDCRQRADLVQIDLTRIVDLGIFLRQQEDFLVVGHRRFEREYGFLAADEQRNYHVRIYIAQG